MFKCETCMILKEQVEYQRKLIDKLLPKSGITPVTESKFADDDGEDPEEKRLKESEHAVTYGI